MDEVVGFDGDEHEVWEWAVGDKERAHDVYPNSVNKIRIWDKRGELMDVSKELEI